MPFQKLKYSWVVSLFLFGSGLVFGQLPKPIINDSSLLREIKQGLDHIYNIEMDKALPVYEKLKIVRPLHPVTPFYRGLMLYWENYPLSLSGDKYQAFVETMDEAISKAYSMWHKNDNDIEGVFFDMMGRAFKMMLYADNGNSTQVIKLAPTAYKNVMKSFDLCTAFNEYYYAMGIYNYYIEAYPEKHPVYKPLTFWFRKGNKELGKQYLQYAKDSTVFMRVEAAVFLAIIYYDFEKAPEKSIRIMEALLDKYPNNPFMMGQYVEYLFYNKQYQLAYDLNQEMVKNHRNNGYVVLKGIVFKALYEEKFLKDYTNAEKHYQMGVKLAESFGAIGEDFLSYAYYGLSRIENKNGNSKKVREYEKKAKSVSDYDHFSD